MVDRNSRMLIVSGISGSGKTSACFLAAKTLAEAGASVGGILCKAILEDGRKTGISCLNMSPEHAGKPWLLATIEPECKPRPTAQQLDDTDPQLLRFGMWQFFKEALKRADEEVVHYLSQIPMDGVHRTVVFIDEIGPLELDRNLGMQRTLAGLDAVARGGGLDTTDYIVVARPDIARRLSSRWPQSALLAIDGMSIEMAAESISRRMTW